MTHQPIFSGVRNQNKKGSLCPPSSSSVLLHPYGQRSPLRLLLCAFSMSSCVNFLFFSYMRSGELHSCVYTLLSPLALYLSFLLSVGTELPHSFDSCMVLPYRICRSLFSHPPIDDHLDCFQSFLFITNNPAINNLVCI